jgi:hypothetical protein
MNSKKLKITEAQYERLLQLMTETPFDVMTKQNIQVGDVVDINWHGKNNKFKVVDNNNGQIIMDNIANNNDRVFMASTSLNGDDLDLRHIDKSKSPDKLNNIQSWPRISLKDISNIQIFRDGKLIDTVDPVSPTAEKQQKKGDDANQANVKTDFMDEVNNDLGTIMEQLVKGKGLNIIFNSGFVNFCCLDSTNTVYTLDLNKNKNTTLPDLNKWDSFVLELKGDPNNDNLYLTNKDIISTNDGITYNLKFSVKAGNNSSEIVIKGINGVNVLPDCESTDEDRPDETEETPEDTLVDAEKVLQMVMSDKTLQDVFYKQPTFWERFKADLAGKKAKGTGLLATIDMVSRYGDKKVQQKIGKGFIKNNQATFMPLENVIVRYFDDNNVVHSYELPMVKDAIRVRRHELDDVTQVLQKKIQDSPLNLRILVKNKTENPNVKICDVQVGIIKNNKYFEDKSEGGTKDVRIEFFESEGYNAQTEQQQPEQ